MALSTEDVKALTAPFSFEDHEFTRGFAYITEQAITRRLDSVDPGWQFIVLETVRDTTSASVTGRLTVCGVSRDGVGTQSIEYATFKDQTGERKPSLDMAGNPREAGEVRKGAATDALKRAARLFGIGRYILDAPKLKMASADQWETRLDAANEKAFRAYLDKFGKAPARAETGNPNGTSVSAVIPTTASPFADLAQVEPDNEPLSPNSLSSLMLEAKRKGVTDAQLLAALGCKEKWGEFKGTMSEARAILDQTAKALKAASGKEPLKEGVL